jgi:predicted AAA+ superfamily ATPase
MKEYSPFTPGVPVPLEFFIGRQREIEIFLNAVGKSQATGTVQRLFISGERGIGKSSICKAAMVAAEQRFDTLGLHVFLGGVTSLEEMVRRIFERLLRESRNKPWHSKVKDFLGNHIKQLDIFGLTIEFSASARELAQAVSDFVPTVTNLLQNLSEQKKGLTIILDDLNGLASSAEFANWLKSLVDDIAVSAVPLPLTVVLVGLPERRTELVRTQPSLNRVFDLIDISKFNREETKEFFRRSFSKVDVSVEDDALDLLCRFSGGYPVFMHEIGDAVFKVDTDGKIDREDTIKGLVVAAQVIGAKYVEPRVSVAIRSENYQGIMRRLAKNPFEHRFARKDVVSGLLPDHARVFDNFLRRMEKLDVIRKDRLHGPGAYEFTSEIHYLYFWLESQRGASER